MLAGQLLRGQSQQGGRAPGAVTLTQSSAPRRYQLNGLAGLDKSKLVSTRLGNWWRRTGAAAINWIRTAGMPRGML